ncbi:MAG TPA: hypothetical protein VGB42_11795 [Candidatus Thermoplasmatota archaeon]
MERVANIALALGALAAGATAYAIRWFHVGWHQTEAMHCPAMLPAVQVLYVLLLLAAPAGATAACLLERRRLESRAGRERLGWPVLAPAAGAVLLVLLSWSTDACV